MYEFEAPEQLIELCEEYNLEVEDALTEAIELLRASLENPEVSEVEYFAQDHYEDDEDPEPYTVYDVDCLWDM